jgi:S-DNA-T family DNA segregation ATPase FtsK/SpoIIIE
MASPLTVVGPAGPSTLHPGPHDTVADLAHAVGLDRVPPTVDGHTVDPSTLLRDSGIRQGSTITATGSWSGPVVVVVAGPCAGRRAVVGDGLVVGSAPWAGLRLPSVPAAAAVVRDADIDPGADAGAVTVTVERPGRLVEQLGVGSAWTLGPHRLVVRGAGRTARGAPSPGRWAAPARRRPAEAPAPEADAIPAPRPCDPAPVRGAATSALVGVGTAALGTVAVAALVGQPLLAVVGLVGTLGTVVGTALDAVRARRARTARRVERAAQADALDTAVTAQLAARARIAQRIHPALDELVDAALGTDGPWPRRPGDPAWGRVAVARRTVPVAPRVDGPVPQEWAAALAARPIEGYPVAVALDAGTVVAVVGPIDAARGAARALAVAAAALHRPSELAVVLADDDPVPPFRSEEWVRWLPAPGPRSQRVLVTGTDARRRIPRPDARTTVVVVADRADAVPGGCDVVVDAAAPGAVGCDPEAAATLTRALAGWYDPALEADTDLPARVPLAAVLAAAGLPDDGLRVALGAGLDGPVVVDLVADGPHLLLAGTTGAGKSEALRTLVAGLVHRRRPDELALLLVDFKGGSAFDVFADVPHVVGVVTDLDDGLADRVLRSLRAELRRREAALRAGAARPVRLVVVVDELAHLVDALGGSAAALVDVAQRGRSLGVHLVLATQRPAGVVDPAVRANVNLVLALRMQDAAEATAVIGDVAPASIPHDRPGRAWLRRGSAPLEALQVAGGAGEIDAVVAAARALGVGVERPAPPWTPPLPDDLDPFAVGPGVVGVIDDPDHQCRHELRWPVAAGPVAVIGRRGSGVRTTVSTLLEAAATGGPVHRYRIVGGVPPSAAGTVAAAGVVRVHVGDRERCERLVAALVARLDTAPGEVAPAEVAPGEVAAGEGAVPVVLALDDLGAVRTAYDDGRGAPVLAGLERLVREGAGARITVVVGADRPGAVPGSWWPALADRWAHDLADGHDAAVLGVPPGRRRPGRVVRASDGLEVQVVHGGTGADHGASTPPVPVLPRSIPTDALADPYRRHDGVVMTIGLGDDLAPVTVTLAPGDRFLVLGPRRSGRTGALAVVADGLARVGVTVVAADGRRPPGEVPAGAVVVVDDADRATDPAWVGLVERTDVTVIAAASGAALRVGYGHWLDGLRRARRGLVLGRLAELDTDLLGAGPVRVGHRPDAPGRGVLVEHGHGVVVQLARLRRRTTTTATAATATPPANDRGATRFHAVDEDAAEGADVAGAVTVGEGAEGAVVAGAVTVGEGAEGAVVPAVIGVLVPGTVVSTALFGTVTGCSSTPGGRTTVTRSVQSPGVAGTAAPYRPSPSTAVSGTGVPAVPVGGTSTAVTVASVAAWPSLDHVTRTRTVSPDAVGADSSRAITAGPSWAPAAGSIGPGPSPTAPTLNTAPTTTALRTAPSAAAVARLIGPPPRTSSS